MLVKLADIVDAIEQASMSDDYMVFFNSADGEIIHVESEIITEIENGEYDNEQVQKMPQWQQSAYADALKVANGSGYIRLPEKFEIHEYSIMERFCYDYPDEKISANLERQIRGRGAFRRFKDALRRYGIDDKWYEYLQQEYCEMARDWCRGHNIEFSEDEELSEQELQTKTIEKVKQAALDNYRSGKMPCSEAVLRAVLGEFSPQSATDEVLAASRGFRGGVDFCGCLCGTLSGAVMAMGICHAASSVKLLHDRFKAAHKATCCRVLTHGLEFGSPERKAHCAELCADAAAICAELILQKAAAKSGGR